MARKKSTRSTSKKSSSSRKGRSSSIPTDLKLEVWGIILMGFAILLGGGLLSLQLHDENLMGPFGQLMGLALYLVFGLGGYLVVVALFSMALGLLTRRFDPRRIRHWLGYLLATLFGTILLYLLFPSYRLEGISAGGKTGEVIGSTLVSLFSKPGTFVISIVGMLVSLILATQESMLQGLRRTLDWTREVVAFTWNVLVSIGSWLMGLFAWEEPEEEDDDAHHESGADEQSVSTSDFKEEEAEVKTSTLRPGAQEETDGKEDTQQKHDVSPDEAENALDRDESPEKDGMAPMPVPSSETASESPSSKEEVLPSRRRPTSTAIPNIVQERYEPRTVDEREFEKETQEHHEFKLPPLALLQDKPDRSYELDRQLMIDKAKQLVTTLKAYKIEGTVREIHPGPVVTQYEFVPKEGTRLSKITALSGEIAMALEATKVRIVAPIPGKNAVGIEIPNENRENVYLKEILMDEKFVKASSKLTVALGKDIKGRPVVMDLAKAPHALVAGTTGSGKSVALNTILVSILYRATPEDVRIIIVDPKQVEFAPYEGIPHLLLPVVTDPDKANAALQWAVREMEERYEKLRILGVREITKYNEKLEKMQAMGEVPVDSKGNPLEKLPYLVILIDEFADLIQVAGKEVELSVSRLGQKARAAGINLILATQRPSADVITGIIRSNITTRLAFLVANKNDSRIILDQGGAETLLGYGDMLFMDRGLTPIRVHGAYVDNSEVNKVCMFLKEQGEPEYDLDILAYAEEQESSTPDRNEKVDALFDQAVALVTERQEATVNLLQRTFEIGYPRARKLMDQLERHGIVSPPKGRKGVREVLAPPPRDI